MHIVIKLLNNVVDKYFWTPVVYFSILSMNKGLIAFYFFFVVVYWRMFYVSEVTTQPHPQT